jgi:hydroxyacylglutathione hydrolase
MQIADDLFFYPWESFTQNNSNSIMISGPVNTLIDPGHAHLFPQLAKQMTADGVTPEEIGLVIYTHCHPDHMEAGPGLAVHGAKQAMHPDDEDYLRKIGPSFFQAMGMSMPDVHIDIHLSEGELDIGGKTLHVYHTPGHSPGEVCLYWAEHNVLIAGDLIFAQGVGRTDFPGGSGALLKKSIQRMAGLDIDILLPGHGPAVMGRDNVIGNFQAIERMYFPML